MYFNFFIKLIRWSQEARWATKHLSGSGLLASASLVSMPMLG
jgi:hypothetical protein